MPTYHRPRVAHIDPGGANAGGVALIAAAVTAAAGVLVFVLAHLVLLAACAAVFTAVMGAVIIAMRRATSPRRWRQHRYPQPRVTVAAARPAQAISAPRRRAIEMPPARITPLPDLARARADASPRARAGTSAAAAGYLDVEIDHCPGPEGSTVAEPDASAEVLDDASAAAARDASLPDLADGSLPGPGDGCRPPCAWCGGPVPARARRDAVCCSKRCRQARHRFGRAAGRAQAAAAVVPLRLAYADPPYPGKAGLYRGHPDYAGEVDHAALAARLAAYDGWALSTSAAALPAVLALCPPGVRVAAWHRGERPAASWQPLPAWEPVIYHPARPVDPARGRRPDSLVHGVSPMTTLPGRVVGAKPAAVCAWIFALIGAAPGDTLDDLFPGSGAVTRAWAAWTSSPAATGSR